MTDKFSINLQLFAGEKTERATPRRREEARKKGQVAKSNEIVTVLVLTLSFLMLQSWLTFMMEDFTALFNHIFTYAQADLTMKSTEALITDIVTVIAKMAGPVLFAALAAGYISNLVQIGFLFTTEPLVFNLNRINPVEGMKRVFSKRAIVELLKSLVKTILVGFVGLSFLRRKLPEFSVLMDLHIPSALEVIGEAIFPAGWRIMAVLLVIAAFDYAYQRYEYEESLKMSKQEVKEEYKNIEGDPQLRAKIRERQRQMATRRMMQEVPKSTVVITNPQHLAVALKYEEEMGVPVVVAKGQDYLAAKIKEIALLHNVVTVENKPLARLLYSRVEIGMAIPADLYQAVAEVIAYVYRLKKRI